MLPQLADFRAEATELNALLVRLAPPDWQRVTQFKAWTVNDIIQHLHDGDLTATASSDGPDAFAQRRSAIQARRDRGMSRIEEARDRFGDLTGERLRQRWFSQVGALCDRLAQLPAETRMAWSGPGMGLRMFATARQMETWAHGQAIHDVMGMRRAATERLRNIAEIGARTYGWTFANRGREAPGPAPHVRLHAPSSAIWEWNAPDPDNVVEGAAEEFCQVVTQTRNIADTSLRVAGEPARAWMHLAQCFAGPPEEPPAPGTRFTAVRGGATESGG
jgi:uncharacterized protein (TIGR03084 family)